MLRTLDRPVRAVIFDMDGVLLDSEPLHDEVNITLLKQRGIDADASVTNPYVGRTSQAMWTELKQIFAIDDAIEHLIDEQWKLATKHLPQSGLVRTEGLSDVLRYLHERDIPMAIASSSRGDFVRAVINHLDLGPYMVCYTSGDEVTQSKPSPEIFLLTAHKLGVRPADTLVIEDSTAGVRAAKAAGMYTVGYDNLTSQGQDLSKADISVKRLDDVISLIGSDMREKR